MFQTLLPYVLFYVLFTVILLWFMALAFLAGRDIGRIDERTNNTRKELERAERKLAAMK